MSMPPNSGKRFLMGFKKGSVILYKNLPIKFTKELLVLIIPNVISQLSIAWIINIQIKSSII